MNFDIIVYRATPAGIMAAISASRLGMSALIIEPTKYIGGLMTSGLNATDTVDKSVITGISREFFLRVQKHYSTQYLPIRLESKVARKIFEEFIAEENITVVREDDISEVLMGPSGITSARLKKAGIVTGNWWVDASYEGDLMAKAGITFYLGRESRDEYNEEWAGVQEVKSFLPWGSSLKIEPKVDGNYIPFVSPPNTLPVGSADSSVQSYCIRVTLTNNAINRVAISAPEEFDFSQFDMFRQLGRSMGRSAVRAAWIPSLGITFKSAYFNLAEIPNGKFDMNSGPLAPINSPALTAGWVEASMEKREEMRQDFIRYTKAILYFIQNDDAVPFPVQAFFSDFGLPADEYQDSGHFPPHVYVREGRRLIGEKVFNQNHIESGGVEDEEAICHGKYHLDCKPVHWRANRAGTNVVREGMFFSSTAFKYGIPSWIILPKRGEADNFFSVCGVSASHVAFGSIRMEPTWMELGSAAAMIARLAQDLGIHPHDVPASQVRTLRDTKFKASASASA